MQMFYSITQIYPVVRQGVVVPAGLMIIETYISMVYIMIPSGVYGIQDINFSTSDLLIGQVVKQFRVKL